MERGVKGENSGVEGEGCIGILELMVKVQRMLSCRELSGTSAMEKGIWQKII